MTSSVRYFGLSTKHEVETCSGPRRKPDFASTESEMANEYSASLKGAEINQGVQVNMTMSHCVTEIYGNRTERVKSVFFLHESGMNRRSMMPWMALKISKESRYCHVWSCAL